MLLKVRITHIFHIEPFSPLPRQMPILLLIFNIFTIAITATLLQPILRCHLRLADYAEAHRLHVQTIRDCSEELSHIYASQLEAT